MWIFTNRGFLSIVDDRHQKGNLLVRARRREHLETLFPGRGIAETPERDYRFRTSVPRAEVAETLRREVESVDYPNFKASLGNEAYHQACHEVWKVMFNYQNRKLS
ncbi:MAG: hypothetical protein KA419_15190 [Acidobacteria bacterium]|nr:hypothetical protein [Acidobacteriota bacterium]